MSAIPFKRIGIDVGGTNTDAALLDGDRVIATIKTPTTADVTTGIRTALSHVLETSGTAPDGIGAVMIGTTHFTNAIVERRHLEPTAIVRVALPAGSDIPPMTDWPADIADALGRHIFQVHGGNEFDGREISPLDPAELAEVATRIRELGVRAIAISAPFSPVTDAMEHRAADLLAEALPNAQITLSHEVGQLGMLERENATILNACLRPLAERTVSAFQTAVADSAITAPLFLTQNDGTLMDAAFAAQFPVRTIASGSSNSVRGAAFLSGLKEALVLDVGGTTCDLGVLVGGFPRRASIAVEVGGVRTNFRMPDVHSFGLGGGTIIKLNGDEIEIGPESVGYHITEQARIFGGDVLTATDIAVANGNAILGDPERVQNLDPTLVTRIYAAISAMIDRGVDRMKISAEPVPLIVVGGGALLVDQVAGVSDLHRPPHAGAANAVGAAIAQVSGEVDRIFALGTREVPDRQAAIQIALQEATASAVHAGARPASIELVDVEDVPLAYLPGNATRIRVKVVGDLNLTQ